jgi:hypothetical protein
VLLLIVVVGGIWISASPGAAVVFCVLMGAAASVILIPAAMVIVWAAQLVEERWLCRNVTGYRAWTEYRQALSEHEGLARALRSQNVDRLRRWLEMDQSELQHAAIRMMARCGHSVQQLEDGAATGFDLLATVGGRQIAVRCHAGSRPCGVAEARQLITAMQDAGASAGLLVAPAGGSIELADYLRVRPVFVVDGGRLIVAEDRADVDLLEGAIGPSARA